jgi:tRNA(Ile)-lysidine synthase
MLVFHLNHMLRGEQADQDEAFVAGLAAGLGLECVARRRDIAAIARDGGMNIEDAGRQERYRLAEQELDIFCQRQGLLPNEAVIATAHTLDDRAETFLMRCMAGAGLGGLCSIPHRNGRVIRPLLDCRRTELADWLAQRGCSWREDQSNSDTTRLRSFVRHELLARMTARNPATLAAMGRTMDILVEEDAYLQEAASSIFERHLVPCSAQLGGAALVLEARILEAPLPIARRAMHMACNGLGVKAARIDFAHIDAIVRDGARHGFAVMLPGGATVRNSHGKLLFFKGGCPLDAEAERHEAGTSAYADAERYEAGTSAYAGAERHEAGMSVHADAELPLEDGACHVIPGIGSIDIALIDAAGLGEDLAAWARRHSTPACVHLDKDALKAPSLTVGRHRRGDRYCPLGMKGASKLLSDVFIDNKVPRHLRGAVPVLRCAGDIVWIVGNPPDERYKLDAESTTIVRVSFMPFDTEG